MKIIFIQDYRFDSWIAQLACSSIFNEATPYFSKMHKVKQLFLGKTSPLALCHHGCLIYGFLKRENVFYIQCFIKSLTRKSVKNILIQFNERKHRLITLSKMLHLRNHRQATVEKISTTPLCTKWTASKKKKVFSIAFFWIFTPILLLSNLIELQYSGVS